MSGKNKNQTAAERARTKEILGAVASTHACASPTCPNPGKPIPMGELYPVVSLQPRRHTVFYHRACGPRVTAGSS
ncbi:MAG TPA: hypothetical protein VFG86_11820 [Chloroflexota bacterium]|nr:hypothetical protein [Chloroflexota bacterium]